jgi:hypothetical protein
MTTTENLRSRMRAWIRSERTPPLAAEERGVMLDAMTAGGHVSISDRALRDLVHTASIALDLQRRGFVRASIRFSQAGQPELIHVELTDQGRRALEPVA